MKLSKETKIAVVMGGLSDEREISLFSGELVLKALSDNGYSNAYKLDAGRDIDIKLREQRPDVIFNALHGTYGEDGRVQGLFDLIGIPYTGSGVAASAVGMNKILSKMVMEKIGISAAKGYFVTSAEGLKPWISYPLVLKESENGSSRGVYIVKTEADWAEAMNKTGAGKKMLVEQYFKGREINVAVLDNKVIGDVEIIPATEFYDYDAKYFRDDTKYIVAPELNPEIRRVIQKAALDFHIALGCRGATRSDFIVRDDSYIMLEINTLPGMTSHSLVPMIAANIGITYIELIEKLLSEALADGQN